jgi:hypothetical protein
MTSRISSFVFCLAFFAGCGNVDPVADDPSGVSIGSLLEQEHGGMTTAPEMPEFNDPALDLVPEMSPTVGTDTLLDASGSFAGDAAPAAERHVFRVMILWGHLPRPADAAGAVATVAPPQSTDWSGSLGIDRGRVSVRRTLGFEERDLVAARTTPDRVSFTSRTLSFVDGMVLTVRTPDAAPTLRFRTAALNADLPLPDTNGDVRYLADMRNGLYYAAYEDRPACNQGFVFGHWGRIRSHLGVFRGHVIDTTGAPAGAVRGIWGQSSNGARVFFGKHINTAGAFNGLLGGTYGDGRFSGHWGTRSGDRGVLNGRYFDGIERRDGRGVFLGRWRETCQ